MESTFVEADHTVYSTVHTKFYRITANISHQDLEQVQGCKNCNPFTGLFSGLTAISNILNISEFSNVKE